jgi:hypothetical protein
VRDINIINFSVRIQLCKVQSVLWNCAALQFYRVELGWAVKAVKSDVNSQIIKS